MPKQKPEATETAPTANPRALTGEALETALAKIIKVLPGTCSFDMDEGAIFGRCMSRIRAWLKEHDASGDYLAKNMDAIEESVRAHIVDRDAKAQARALRHQAREEAVLNKALEE